MRYLQSYYSDVGTSRPSNQDSLAILKADTDRGEVVMALVCDGMGGYSCGEIASKYCVEQAAAWFKEEFPFLLSRNTGGEAIKEELHRLVKQINHDLALSGAEKKVRYGSTFTLLLFFDDQCHIAHVGDSRACRIGDKAEQLTRDQSVVGHLVETGQLTAEQARTDKRKHLLRECMGVTDAVNMYYYTEPIQPDHTYLICSDGFWHELSDAEYVRYLRAADIRDNADLRRRLQYLTDQVKRRGERDNISAVGVIPKRGG